MILSNSPRIKRLRKVAGSERKKVNGKTGMIPGVRDIQMFFSEFKDQSVETEGESGNIDINTHRGAISDKFTHNPRTGKNHTDDELTGGRRGGVEDAPI